MPEVFYTVKMAFVSVAHLSLSCKDIVVPGHQQDLPRGAAGQADNPSLAILASRLQIVRMVGANPTDNTT